MISHDSTGRRTASVGATDTAAFTIRASGKAFKVLIDGLYSDKVLAVIRELWTNAYDSHIAVGKPDVSFECKLPTVLDPEFSVRDFGTGMDHDTVMTLYSTMFSSSKDTSNDQVGMLGLGSKSPFAYTDTFTLTCYDGENARYYSAYLGNDGVPQISLLGELPTQEAAGVSVSFPVNSGDFSKFSERARSLLEGFPVKPVVTPTINYVQPAIAMSGDGWVIYASSYQGLKAKQGCVVYPVSSNEDWMTPDAKAVSGLPMTVDFKIGDLEVTASREALSYNPSTRDAINARLEKVCAEVRKHYEVKISGCSTMWEASIALQEAADTTHLSGSAFLTLFGKVEWNGTPVHRKFPTGDAFTDNNVSGTLVGFQKARRTDRYFKCPFVGSAHYTLSPCITELFVEDSKNLVRNAVDRIRYVYNGKSVPATVLWLRADLSDGSLDAALEQIGNPPYRLVSDLPVPPPEAHTRAPRNPVSLHKLVGNYLNTHMCALSDGGYFFPMERGEIMSGYTDGSRQMTRYQAADVVAFAVKLGLVPDGATIVCIPATFKRRLAKHIDKWTNVYDLAKGALTPEMLQASVDSSMAAAWLRDNRELVAFVDAYAMDPEYDPQSPFNTWVTLINEVREQKSAMSIPTAFTYHMTMPQPTFKVRLTRSVDVMKQVTVNYPMLRYYFNTSTYIESDEAVNYVKTIDKLATVNSIDSGDDVGQSVDIAA